MAMNTFSMIPCVFSVSLKNVAGRIVSADQVQTLPTGLPSRGQRMLPRESSLMRLHYPSTSVPDASWPRQARERGCEATKLNQTANKATKG